jgi:hypothetical protein
MTSALSVLALVFGMDADGPKALDEFFIVPIRIHILSSPEFGLANCTLRDSDVTRVVGKLNAIWSQAGITFGVESIMHEQVAQRDRFRLVVELKQGALDLSDLDMLLPKASRVFDGLSVYFLHELPFNGIYTNGDCVVLQERVRLNDTQGGTDEPMARVAGHCLGRALSLQPRQEPVTSLMALGTTGFGLDAEEVERARLVAKTVPGALTVSDARKAADTAHAQGDETKAKRLKSWIDAAANAKAGGPARAKPAQDPPPDNQKRHRGRELTSR